ncbi:YciI family protein [Jidongwangia harbinensis]|uniref:YciI family protein n=1 Tax=Jidongwangia harbinensis TaxID=2878561 RepID=UPI001CDA3133|nr:YciI family protein [Jidongwangia harbinensis]MCA2212820.1 YciI family protein [Jidongwangia harbinensis]
MISTYSAPLEQVDEARADHLRFIDGLDERGLVVSAGRQEPPAGGVVLLDVDSAAEARALMAEDPYVVRGLAAYEAIGWQPTRGVLADWARDRT